MKYDISRSILYTFGMGGRMNEIKITNTTFEDIKHIDESGNEYWLARELQIILDYKKWQSL